VAAPLVVVALTSGGSEAADPLRIERSAGGRDVPGLVVYVDPASNTPEVADGNTSVELECLDAAGEVKLRASHPWPFTDTDAGTLDAHVHQFVEPDEVGSLERCRLAGTEGPLEGAVGGPGLR
jgi:hypothetical protein